MEKGEKTSAQNKNFVRGRAPKHIKRYVLGALVTKKTTIGRILEKYPESISVFNKYGLHCLGCQIALTETIEEAARAHQINLKIFLGDLNRKAL